MCDELNDDYSKEEEAAIRLKAEFAAIMFDFINKHCGKDNPDNLYPRAGYILVDVLTECLEQAQRQLVNYHPFTTLQSDHICWQIGEWYLYWKNNLTEPYVPHKLGFAKELLKTMICGE